MAYYQNAYDAIVGSIRLEATGAMRTSYEVEQRTARSERVLQLGRKQREQGGIGGGGASTGARTPSHAAGNGGDFDEGAGGGAGRGAGADGGSGSSSSRRYSYAHDDDLVNESFAPTFEDRVKLQIAQNLLDAPLSMLVSDAERKQMRSLPRKLRKKLNGAHPLAATIEEQTAETRTKAIATAHGVLHHALAAMRDLQRASAKAVSQKRHVAPDVLVQVNKLVKENLSYIDETLESTLREAFAKGLKEVVSGMSAFHTLHETDMLVAYRSRTGWIKHTYQEDLRRIRSLAEAATGRRGGIGVRGGSGPGNGDDEDESTAFGVARAAAKLAQEELAALKAKLASMPTPFCATESDHRRRVVANGSSYVKQISVELGQAMERLAIIDEEMARERAERSKAEDEATALRAKVREQERIIDALRKEMGELRKEHGNELTNLREQSTRDLLALTSKLEESTKQLDKREAEMKAARARARSAQKRLAAEKKRSDTFKNAAKSRRRGSTRSMTSEEELLAAGIPEGPEYEPGYDPDFAASRGKNGVVALTGENMTFEGPPVFTHVVELQCTCGALLPEEAAALHTLQSVSRTAAPGESVGDDAENQRLTDAQIAQLLPHRDHDATCPLFGLTSGVPPDNMNALQPLPGMNAHVPPSGHRPDTQYSPLVAVQHAVPISAASVEGPGPVAASPLLAAAAAATAMQAARSQAQSTLMAPFSLADTMRTMHTRHMMRQDSIEEEEDELGGAKSPTPIIPPFPNRAAMGYRHWSPGGVSNNSYLSWTIRHHASVFGNSSPAPTGPATAHRAPSMRSKSSLGGGSSGNMRAAARPPGLVGSGGVGVEVTIPGKATIAQATNTGRLAKEILRPHPLLHAGRPDAGGSKVKPQVADMLSHRSAGGTGRAAAAALGSLGSPQTASRRSPSPAPSTSRSRNQQTGRAVSPATTQRRHSATLAAAARPASPQQQRAYVDIRGPPPTPTPTPGPGSPPPAFHLSLPHDQGLQYPKARPASASIVRRRPGSPGVGSDEYQYAHLYSVRYTPSEATAASPVPGWRERLQPAVAAQRTARAASLHRGGSWNQAQLVRAPSLAAVEGGGTGGGTGREGAEGVGSPVPRRRRRASSPTRTAQFPPASPVTAPHRSRQGGHHRRPSQRPGSAPAGHSRVVQLPSTPQSLAQTLPQPVESPAASVGAGVAQLETSVIEEGDGDFQSASQVDIGAGAGAGAGASLLDAGGVDGDGSLPLPQEMPRTPSLGPQAGSFVQLKHKRIAKLTTGDSFATQRTALSSPGTLDSVRTAATEVLQAGSTLAQSLVQSPVSAAHHATQHTVAAQLTRLRQQRHDVTWDRNRRPADGNSFIVHDGFSPSKASPRPASAARRRGGSGKRRSMQRPSSAPDSPSRGIAGRQVAAARRQSSPSRAALTPRTVEPGLALAAAAELRGEQKPPPPRKPAVPSRIAQQPRRKSASRSRSKSPKPESGEGGGGASGGAAASAGGSEAATAAAADTGERLSITGSAKPVSPKRGGGHSRLKDTRSDADLHAHSVAAAKGGLGSPHHDTEAVAGWGSQ